MGGKSRPQFLYEYIPRQESVHRTL